MANLDPEILAHLEWLGFVRPTGLVVSAAALVRAGAILDRRDAEGQRLLRACIVEKVFDPKVGPVPYLPAFVTFAECVLGWSFSPKGFAGTAENPIPTELEMPLPDYGETLRPDFAVRELEPKGGASPWQLLVRVLEPGEDIDCVIRHGGRLEASAHGRMERLLRHTGAPSGVLFNGRAIRLLSAPRGESSGWIDFRVEDMVQTAGRPISTALRLLLGQPRLLSAPRGQRLAALLDASRKFQNEVSERLAEQVLHALYELLRGFQAANDASKGDLLRQALADHPDQVYTSLLTVILRLVFLLYAEQRDMLPQDETFLRFYSLAGLYERLRDDVALFPDTMDQRFGAWAQLLVLFRMIHDGADSGEIRLPRRHGVLFDPDRFKFLEGRPLGAARQIHRRIEPPLVPDGTIYRALDKLLVLDGERISYRALDVEQIGSVYETMMGFRLETATGRSVAIRTNRKQGAPTAVDLEALLSEPAAKREKWLQELAGIKLTERVSRVMARATTLEDLHASLRSVIDSAATPDLVPKGAMMLQPSEERRRSGSHYTPRVLTEPIVRTTLEPILARLRQSDGRPPRPAQILELKICDPAMGSGAFLVETCRQLGASLVEAWHIHGEVPAIPADEREEIFAMRQIAQRCLYGVDRNPVAVDLSKVSLWLATLAKDHAFTFVDHALRHGDSLVGLSLSQIESFHWDCTVPRVKAGFETMRTREQVALFSTLRQRIREASETVPDVELRSLWDQALFELSKVRLLGDLVVAAFFEGDKPKVREERRSEYASAVLSGDAERYRAWLEDRRQAERPFVPFHWGIEFIEVFDRPTPGFDAIVGNPPFLGGTGISTHLGEQYRNWLYASYPEASNRCDLVAYFFRRSFEVISVGGTFGLIASNTIAQGDTRAGGLRWICQHDGQIFAARKRVTWPGLAAVVVSVVHVVKGKWDWSRRLDDRDVEIITAFLFHRGGHNDPARLASNSNSSFTGVKIYGQGFIFDDQDAKGSATSLAEMRRLINKDPLNAARIFPYIGGEEINTSPIQEHNRFVIDFDEMDEIAARRWPDLISIVERKVKPERAGKAKDVAAWPWWRFWRSRRDLYEAIAGLERVLVINCGATPHFAFAFQPSNRKFAHSLAVFPLSTYSAFCALQSRPHEIWSRFFGSSMKDDLRYTPSDCFETFPFPENWAASSVLECAGRDYYEFRAALMVRNDEGMTKTYNRFHDPEELDAAILRLRELHTAMDDALLRAYGWTDIPTVCGFFLDYEIDGDESSDKKKPYRYRWPDNVRDEVLGRLLELNEERARAETLSVAISTGTREKVRSPDGRPNARTTKDMFS